MSKTVIQYDWNSTTLCPSCFYGSICQFTTSYYSISLEALLYTPIQSRWIIASIIVVLLIGTVCNILSIATFCQKETREMSNGIYRLWIAIVGQLGTMALATRLLLILGRKSSGIIECFGLDYLISILPALYNSLTACVVVERAVVVFASLSYNKQRSRFMTKIVIPILILYHFLIALHEPFHRQLLADSQLSTRSWCSLHLHTRFLITYERTTNIVHLVLPFAFNLFAPVVMFIVLIRHKTTLTPNVTIWYNSKNVLYTYKRHFISPYILIVLMTPRLIVASRLICITQSWQNTVYLSVYLISLVPLMATLVIFVLPSPTCREELYKMYQRAILYVPLR